jgi:hypothetical protein
MGSDLDTTVINELSSAYMRVHHGVWVPGIKRPIRAGARVMGYGG